MKASNFADLLAFQGAFCLSSEIEELVEVSNFCQSKPLKSI
jgi:hypothetical protein